MWSFRRIFPSCSLFARYIHTCIERLLQVQIVRNQTKLSSRSLTILPEASSLHALSVVTPIATRELLSLSLSLPKKPTDAVGTWHTYVLALELGVYVYRRCSVGKTSECSDNCIERSRCWREGSGILLHKYVLESEVGTLYVTFNVGHKSVNHAENRIYSESDDCQWYWLD